MPELRFTVPGPPRGKGRPRFSRPKSGVVPRPYTDAKTVAYENEVCRLARAASRGVPVFDCPVSVRVTFVFEPPKMCAKVRRRGWAAPAGPPDLDNCAKAVLDGCNQAMVWEDDSRVVELLARKVYGEPCCHVVISDKMIVPSSVTGA